MTNKILITYASKHGSTAEIAEKIHEIFTNHGLKCEIKSVEDVNDISAYETIVLGSAVYIGQWRKSTVKFLKKNEETLIKKKLWLFSTGPTGKGDPVELLKGWKYPDALKDTIDKISPEEITVFHGALNEAKLNTFEKMTIKMVKAPMGDYRDWEQVKLWANDIIKSLISDK